MTSSSFMLGKKILALTLVIALTAGAFPRPADAMVVKDPFDMPFDIKSSIEETLSNFFAAQGLSKERIEDGLATLVARLALRSVVKSTLNWMASGFEGSPAFVRDLNTNLRQLGDAVVSDLASDILQEAIETPFGTQIAEGVIAGYYLYTSRDRLQSRLQYSLNSFSQNPSAFLYGDFSQGGWRAFNAANRQCGNNVYCVQFAVHDELVTRVRGQVDQRLRELEWGRGFLSWRGECRAANINGQVVKAEGDEGLTLGDKDECLSRPINTLGSVLIEQDIKVLGSDIDQLVTADEINEAVAGLLNSLLNKVLAGDGQAGGYGGGSVGQRPGDISPTIATSFAQSLGIQRDRVLEYRENWAKIGDMANQAKVKLESCQRSGNAELLENEVEPVVEEAAAAETKAVAAIAALEDLESRAAQAGANSNVGFDTIVSDFETLMASDTLPTSAEVTNALSESVDTEGTEPLSKFSRMKEISEEACRLRGAD